MDYLVNPKNKILNSQCIYRAFVDENIFNDVCQRHVGLFDEIKKTIKCLKEERYQVVVDRDMTKK